MVFLKNTLEEMKKLFKVRPNRWWSIPDWKKARIAEKLLNWLYERKTILKIANIKINLTHFERLMILDALNDPCYKDKVQSPATKRFIREIYKKLREKVRNCEQLSHEIKESMNGK